MRISVLGHDEQSDYEHGCIEMLASNEEDAFRLGVLLEKVNSEGKHCVGSASGENVFIRVPLAERGQG